MAFPSNIGTGTVTGRLLAPRVDGPLPGLEKFAVPAGVEVILTPEVPRISAPAAAPAPVTFVANPSTPIRAILDSEGYLCTPDPDNLDIPQFRGVRLIATDSAGLVYVGWQWRATVMFPGRRNPLYSVLFQVPSGGEVDLTNATEVSTLGSGIGLIWFGDTEPPAAGNYTIWVQPDGTWLTLEAS